MSDSKEDKLIEFEAEREYNKAASNFAYPRGVQDNKAYDNYLIFKNAWQEHIQRYFEIKISNKKEKIDLAQHPNKIDEFLSTYKGKINQQNVDFIKKTNLDIYSIVQKSVLYRKRAFGDNKASLNELGFIPDELSSTTPIIIDLAGRFFKSEEIHETLCKDLEITSVSVYQIKQIIKENITKVKELQEKFKSDYSDVRLGYKRGRLEELQYIYNKRKNIYEKNYNREDEKQLISIMENIKKEIQGDIVLNANINLQIEDQTNIFLKNEVLKTLNIAMLIIARISGKQNVNPQLILSRLAHSKYAQFTGYGMNGLSPTALEDEIDYSSSILYDWSKIKENNAEINLENEKLAKLPSVDNSALNIKERLKLILSEAKKPLDASKDSLDLTTNS